MSPTTAGAGRVAGVEWGCVCGGGKGRCLCPQGCTGWRPGEVAQPPLAWHAPPRPSCMPRACLQHMCCAMPPTCAGALGRAAQDAGVAELLASLGARGQLRAEVAAALQALVAGARGAHAAGGVAGACARAWQWRSRGTGGHWSAGLSDRCQETWCTARFPLSARRGADAPLTSAVSGSELGHEGGGQVHGGDVGRVDRQCPARVGAGRRPGLGRRAGASDVVWSRVGWSGGSHLVEGRPGRGTCGSLPSPQRAVRLQAGRRSLPRRAPGRRSRPQLSLGRLHRPARAVLRVGSLRTNDSPGDHGHQAQEESGAHGAGAGRALQVQTSCWNKSVWLH